MSIDYCKTPFPWFGGKTDAAPHVWEALGDVAHYVEPFFGGGAVLLRRPHPCNRMHHSETVNDANGLLINAWRAIQMHPEATAEAASWPVAEADLMARHLALLRWQREHELERLMADPEFCDPRIAGWWLWGVCSWIGSGWCDGSGPWIVGTDGRVTKRTGSGGAIRQLPYVADNGRGVNHPGLREPGVSAGTPERSWETGDFHPMTMPELLAWFRFLSARLRHVRILHGDWTRALGTGVTFTLDVRMKQGVCGVFLDPPYSAEAGRDMGLYAVESGSVAHDVRAWCLANGNDRRLRIVLAGFAGEGHEELESHGWRSVSWFKDGHLKGGMRNQRKQRKESTDGDTGNTGKAHQQHRERLWLSPHCLERATEPGLFDSLLDAGEP